MNWLERARDQIRESMPTATANTADRNPTAVMAVATPVICADRQACPHNLEDQTSPRVHRELQASMHMPTANTADRNPTAVMAVPDTALLPNLRACQAIDDTPEDLLSRAMLEEFEERAAIMEFDGGLNRQDAEREAALEVISRYRLH